MKLSYALALSLSSFGLLVSSCNSDISTEKKNNLSATSEVERMEAASNTSYFKKDLTIIDKESQSQVVLRVASSSQTALENCLKSVDFSLKLAGDYSQLTSVAGKPVDKAATAALPSRSDQPSILLEVISSDIKSASKNYTLSTSPKPGASVNKTSGSGKYYSQHFEYISDVWPEFFYIDLRAAINIQYGWDRRDHWSSGYVNADNGYLEANGPVLVRQRVDGPYKVKVHVWANYGRDNWDVTFITDGA